MDITTLIPTAVDIIKSYSWFNIVAAVVTLASTIAAVTPTPTAGSKLALVYKLVDVLALNIGKAKQTGK
jgi:hypothetical protein